MKNIQVWVIKDPEGNVWQTPKGKSSWNSSGAAKNAWCYHQYWGVSSSWDKHAVGWVCEKIAEYELRPVQ